MTMTEEKRLASINLLANSINSPDFRTFAKFIYLHKRISDIVEEAFAFITSLAPYTTSRSAEGATYVNEFIQSSFFTSYTSRVRAQLLDIVQQLREMVFSTYSGVHTLQEYASVSPQFSFVFECDPGILDHDDPEFREPTHITGTSITFPSIGQIYTAVTQWPTTGSVSQVFSYLSGIKTILSSYTDRLFKILSTISRFPSALSAAAQQYRKLLYVDNTSTTSISEADQRVYLEAAAGPVINDIRLLIAMSMDLAVGATAPSGRQIYFTIPCYIRSTNISGFDVDLLKVVRQSPIDHEITAIMWFIHSWDLQRTFAPQFYNS